MNVSEIIQLMESCKTFGVQVLTLNGLSIRFGGSNEISPSPLTHGFAVNSPVLNTDASVQNSNLNSPKQNNQPVIDSKALEALLKPLNPFEGLSEEEILYASTPYFEELQAKKEEHQKKLNEELNR